MRAVYNPIHLRLYVFPHERSRQIAEPSVFRLCKNTGTSRLLAKRAEQRMGVRKELRTEAPGNVKAVVFSLTPAMRAREMVCGGI